MAKKTFKRQTNPASFYMEYYTAMNGILGLSQDQLVLLSELARLRLLSRREYILSQDRAMIMETLKKSRNALDKLVERLKVKGCLEVTAHGVRIPEVLYIDFTEEVTLQFIWQARSTGSPKSA
jgi:hypothetical protein